MKRTALFTFVSLGLGLMSMPAQAALKAGDAAPDFTAAAAVNGQTFTYSLKAERAKGPVVVYFYPAAFTKGCSLEAHNFAEAINDFKASGATVIGVSYDNLDTLKKFSQADCQGKFPVAADTNQSIMKSYDTVWKDRPDKAMRTSYVISPEGKVLFAHSELDATHHVEYTLDAVKKWKAAH